MCSVVELHALTDGWLVEFSWHKFIIGHQRQTFSESRTNVFTDEIHHRKKERSDAIKETYVPKKEKNSGRWFSSSVSERLGEEALKYAIDRG